MRFLSILLAAVLLCGLTAQALPNEELRELPGGAEQPGSQDFLRPYPTEQQAAVPDLKKLWDIPLDQPGYEVIRSYRSRNIEVEEIYYQSREYKGKPSRIFGYFAYPAGKTNLPAILVSHGGGGTAKLSTVVNWAKRGYAVLAIDLPGKGYARASSRSTGPDMDVPILLRTQPDPSYNYLVHAVAALRNGITFLTGREEVDPNRIGMVGLSWGGVLTLLTNGQDERLKTAVNIFGAGYIPEGCTWQDRFYSKSEQELKDWYSYIDPKNFLKSQHSPILFLTGTNDHCYYLPTFQKSFEEVTVAKKLVLIPNMKHQFMPAQEEIVLSWLDSKLKRPRSFPEVEVQPLQRKGGNRLIIPAIASSGSPLSRATISYTEGTPSQWTTRKWQTSQGYYEDGFWYFSVPTALVQPDLLFFVTVKDSWGGVASTPVRSLMKIRLTEGNYTYAMSSPIQKINVHEPPLQILGLTKLPALFKLFLSKQYRTYFLYQPAGGS